MSIGYKQQSSASVPTPASGEMNTFIDSADGKLKRKDDTGTVTNIEAIAAGVASFEGRTGAVVSVAGDYTASEITNVAAGNIVAATVQAAINELDSEKAPVTHVGSGGVSEHALATGAVAGFMSPGHFSIVDDFDNNVDARITLQKGAANGLATLDAGSKVPLIQLPSSIVGGMVYQGAWDANTNSPALASNVGTKGYYYVVNVAGTTLINGINDWQVTDWIVFNGTVWEKIDNTETGVVGGDLTGNLPNPSLVAFGTAGTYTKVTTDSKGRVQSGTTLSASDIPSLPANKIPLATTSADGYLSSTDWNTFNGKQAAGNYITALTGEVTASGPGSSAATVSNSAVIAKVLTGLAETYGVVSAADSILQAIQKLVYSQSIHKIQVSTDLTVPSGYVMTRGYTELTGSSVLTVQSGAILNLI